MAKPKLRILIISSQYPPTIGGGGTFSSYLCHELTQLNLEVVLLTSTINDLPKKEVKNRITIYRTDFKQSESLIYESAIKVGLSICEVFAPDIIHGQHIDGAIVGMHLKASFNIPLIVTLHKTPLLNYDESVSKRNPVYCNLRFLITCKFVDIFIAGSKIFQEELVKIGVNDQNLRFIYHGIPYRYLQSLAFNKEKGLLVSESLLLQSNEKLIVCPSRLDERKGLDILILAASKLHKYHPETKFKLLITGEARENNDHDFRIMNNLIDLAKKGNISDKLIFKKFDFENLPALFGLASLCILPSSKEGLGLVLLESLSVKCPVIAANTQGINEVIENEDSGLLFESGDFSDLFSQMERMLNQEDLRRVLKNNGFKKVKQVFSGQRMALEHKQLYQEIIKNHKKQG